MPLHSELQHDLGLTDDTQRFHTSSRLSLKAIEVRRIERKHLKLGDVRLSQRNGCISAPGGRCVVEEREAKLEDKKEYKVRCIKGQVPASVTESQSK